VPSVGTNSIHTFTAESWQVLIGKWSSGAEGEEVRGKGEE
jgi:hypothetical protein